MKFHDRLILQGIHPEYNCMCKTYQSGGKFYAECREFHFTSVNKRTAISKVLSQMVKYFKSGGKLTGFRYGDFKYIALYKDGLPASVDIFDADYPINDWHGSGFDAREVTAKEYIAIRDGNCKMWEANYTPRNLNEYSRTAVDNTIYPVRASKKLTRGIV